MALTYRVVEGWEQLPAGMIHRDTVGVDVDANDRVYIFTRQKAQVFVYEQDGTFVRSWGADFFTERAHGLTVAPDGTILCVDEGAQVVYRFTPEGELLQTIGNKGVASDTGYDGSLTSIVRGGPPFNRPTNVAVAANGDLYVSDGYGNARVHRFSASGELIQSWGEPGNGPAQFNLVHGVAISADGRVFIADRENDRIQIFSPDGEFLDEWTHIQRPTNIRFGKDGRAYVSELWRKLADPSFRLGPTSEDRPGRVAVLSPDGEVLARWGGPDRCAPGNFVAPHDICVDSKGDIYVAEVTWTFGINRGEVPDGCHMFQKFARVEE